MRRVTLLVVALVAANALAFAWWTGRLRAWTGPDPASSPVARQVAPERVRPVPLARFEAARPDAAAPSPGACFAFAPLDPAAVERVAAWLRGRPGVARADAFDGGLRITFAAAAPSADRQAQLAELAAAAGRAPAPC